MRKNLFVISGILGLIGLSAYLISCSGGMKGSTSGGSTGGTDNTCTVSPADSANLSCTTSIFGGAPGWLNNFKCVTITENGGNYVITTNDQPNHKSYYYGSGNPSKYEALPSGHHGNPNSISSQNFSFDIPKSPSLGATPTSTSMGPVGVSVNGVVFFNNQAAPGDSLVEELATMDKGNGHPTNTGIYHYHSEPCYLTNNSDELIGVMRDGFPVYGRKEQDGSDPVYVDTCTVATASSVENCRPYPMQMPNFHCHATNEFPSGVCHYHVIKTDPFIIEYYAGTVGSML